MHNIDSTQISTCLLFSAGLGTRLKPITNNLPKALAPLNGKPLLWHNINYLQKFGVKKIVVNVHHFADMIIDYVKDLQDFDIDFVISDERDLVLETGGGLWFAKDKLYDSTHFYMMNVDILTSLDLGKMAKFHFENNPIATLAVTQRSSSRKLLFDHKMQLQAWHNKTNGEYKWVNDSILNIHEFAFSGIHIASNKIFDFTPNAKVFSIIDWYLNIAKQSSIIGFEHSNDWIIDVGKPESLLEAEKYLSK